MVIGWNGRWDWHIHAIDTMCKTDPWSRKIPAVGNGNSLQYSRLGNPWTEEPGGLQSMGLQTQTHTHKIGDWREPTVQLRDLYSVPWGGLNGKEIQKKKADICVHIADSLCCTAATNTALESNWNPIKSKLKKKTQLSSLNDHDAKGEKPRFTSSIYLFSINIT